MQNCSSILAPLVKGETFSLDQCPKNAIKEEEMRKSSVMLYGVEVLMVGSLMYALVCTRPALTFLVGMLSRYQSNPRKDHWKAAKKVLRYLQGTKEYTLTYRHTDLLEVVGYFDSDYKGSVVKTVVQRSGKRVKVLITETREQISQSPIGIFINQSKYALEMLKKYGLYQCDPVDIPMVEKLKLDEDPNGTLVDPTRYRGMVESLMYLTASRPYLVFSVWMCARYQAKPTEKHLITVKWLFRYLKETIIMGLWYPKDAGCDLTAFADANHAGCQDSRKSTSGSAQFLGEKLVSWSFKKQKCTAISLLKLNISPCSVTVHIFDYNIIPLYCDSESAIALSCNIVQHYKTKHIAVRYHFIKEQAENEIVELYFVKTAYQMTDIFTKSQTKMKSNSVYYFLYHMHST
ncbi:hypothetical protein Tco_1293150 [Tanacetum coccineum]